MQLYHRALPSIALLAGFAVGCGAPADDPIAQAGAPASDATPDASAPGDAGIAANDGDAGSRSETPADGAPAPTCDPLHHGARADGKTKDTAALQAAIDACAGTGGVVRIHDGTYLTGTLRLASDLTFRVEPSATVRGTQDDADYPTQSPKTDNTQLKNCRKALLYAEGVHDLVLDGGGTIDGNGNSPKWIGPSSVHPEATRPMLFFGVLAERVTVRDLTLKNAAMWGLVNMEVDDLRIERVTIDTPLSGNRDGIDVVDCHRVTIADVTITSEDDSICFKSGTRRGVSDVTVKNAHVVRSIVANALKFGTASYGGFAHVLFDGVTIDGADKAAMAVESVDGADVRDITFRNVTFRDVGTPFFVLLGDRGSTPADDVHRIGTIDGIHFENVTGSGMRYHWASPISGLADPGGTTHRLHDLTFVDVHVTNRGGLGAVPPDPPEYAGQYPDPNLWGDMPAFGLFVRHADVVTLTRSTPLVTGTDARRAIEARDVTGLKVE